MKMHQQMFYFECKNALPTKKDADFNGCILVWDGLAWIYVTYYQACDYSHWMQMPKAPCEDDRDF